MKKFIRESTKTGRKWDYPRQFLYGFVQMLQDGNVEKYQNRQRKRGGRTNVRELVREREQARPEVQEREPSSENLDASESVNEILEDLPEEIEVNACGQKVDPRGAKCTYYGYEGLQENASYQKYPDLRSKKEEKTNRMKTKGKLDKACHGGGSWYHTPAEC